MDRLILAEKLESLRRCVQRVEARRTETVDALRLTSIVRTPWRSISHARCSCVWTPRAS